jgi:rhodanese-related sulfurtransferase
MAGYDVVHVAVAPPSTLEEELVKKVAAIVGKNLYETRLRLTGRIPKIIAHCETMQQAELAAQSLRGLGLVVIVCPDSKLRKSSPRYKAHSLKFDEQAIIFCDRSGRERRMEASEAFLILTAGFKLIPRQR